MATCEFSTEELAEFRAAFKELGGDETDVNADLLGPILRALGQNPTETELGDLKLMMPATRAGRLRLSEFTQVLAGKFAVADASTMLRQVFDVFDKNESGKISASEVEAVMASLGEPIPLSEVEDMLREVKGAESGIAEVTFDDFLRVVSKGLPLSGYKARGITVYSQHATTCTCRCLIYLQVRD